ncbi:3783_t:CDS:2 [Funneliformis geosporum]|nr:3783_t:CDS:2 [Funneliformis geosporum]
MSDNDKDALNEDPNTLDYMILMEYANGGLNEIHNLQLVHCDFHDGNILFNNISVYISDLGLCKPVEYFQSSKKNDIYGILPFIAPEVLRGQPYTLASDIYSFSMIMWKLVSGISPFDNKVHDAQLALNICKGERPEIISNIPQSYIDLMTKCWDKDPLKRPTASELEDIFFNWIYNENSMYVAKNQNHIYGMWIIYFEVEIINKGENGLGSCGGGYGDDGQMLFGSEIGKPYVSILMTGDTIGCCLNIRNDQFCRSQRSNLSITLEICNSCEI